MNGVNASAARYLLAWSVFTLLGCLAVHARASISRVPMPDEASTRWAYEALAQAAQHLPLTAAPPRAEHYRAGGAIFVSVYVHGQRVARHVAGATLTKAVREAGVAFARQPLLALAFSARKPADRPRFRIELTRGDAALVDALPWLRALLLVPLRDGLCATQGTDGGRSVCLTPDDIWGLGLYDRAVVAPIPDLTFGTDLALLEQRLADDLGTTRAELHQNGRVRRVRIEAMAPWPTETPRPALTREQLETAARDGAKFVLRHQARSGRYTYVYDAQHDRALAGDDYSLPRHGGTTYFLAQAAQRLAMPEARAGARRALGYLRASAITTCGAPDRLCVLQDGEVEVGASALTALAAAELLQSGDDADVSALLSGLTAFLRAQQRPDGELMHEYDRKRERAVDVQHMYYSGETAMALLTAYERTRDPRDLQAARRLMAHLTGAGWSFFGSRYFYGEEHWTCQAVGKAAAYMDVSAALAFCVRWARWQSHLQYAAGDTPWPSEGAFGVGPVLLPRVTTAASRVEASVPLFRVLRAHQQSAHGVTDASELRELRRVIERSVGLLLRQRWAPGPTHLFRNPARAYGGMPGTAADLTSRTDMVQHAGSALLAWARDGVFDAQ